jgi:GNAT superfamily N-acetyltransferase
VPSSQAEVEVRRLRADEWRQFRDLRLEALRDAPLAFGSTYEREAAFGGDRWQQQATAAEAGIGEVAFVAVADERHVGMARGYQGFSDDANRRPVTWLIGVYVDPAWRGHGLAGRLSTEVIAWARERGASEILLHVADWNESARRVYEALGFEPTGEHMTLPHLPSVVEIEMRLRL